MWQSCAWTARPSLVGRVGRAERQGERRSPRISPSKSASNSDRWFIQRSRNRAREIPLGAETFAREGRNRSRSETSARWCVEPVLFARHQRQFRAPSVVVGRCSSLRRGITCRAPNNAPPPPGSSRRLSRASRAVWSIGGSITPRVLNPEEIRSSKSVMNATTEGGDGFFE